MYFIGRNLTMKYSEYMWKPVKTLPNFIHINNKHYILHRTQWTQALWVKTVRPALSTCHTDKIKLSRKLEFWLFSFRCTTKQENVWTDAEYAPQSAHWRYPVLYEQHVFRHATAPGSAATYPEENLAWHCGTSALKKNALGSQPSYGRPESEYKTSVPPSTRCYPSALQFSNGPWLWVGGLFQLWSGVPRLYSCRGKI